MALVPLIAALDFGRRLGPSDVRMRPLARAWLPMGIALLVYLGLRVWVFGSVQAGFDRITTFWGLDTGRMISLRIEMLGGYLGLLAWPAELNLFREIRPVLPPWDGALWVAVGWILSWCAAFVVLLRRGARPALCAILFIPAGILPALVRIEAIGRFPLSERFLYLSVLGIALLVATAVVRLLPRIPATLVLAVLCVGAGWKAHDRVGFWKDEKSLFFTAALDNPRSAYVQWSLGRVLLEQYKLTYELEVLDEARNAFLRSRRSASPARRVPSTRPFSRRIGCRPTWATAGASSSRPWRTTTGRPRSTRPS